MEERLSQQRAPVFEALKRFQRMRVVPFDVPGHKRGKGTPELTAFLGEQCMSVDVNSMKPLDNLCHPVSVCLLYTSTAAYGAEGVPVSQALVDLIIVLGVIAVLAGLKHRPQIHSVYPQLLEMGNPVHQLFDPVDPFPVGVEAGRSAEAERINMIKYGFCNPIHHESLLPWSDL